MNQQSKFIAFVKQQGYGCDYTIGCGHDLWKLKAQSHEEALRELKEKILGWPFTNEDEGCYDDLEFVTLYEIGNETIVPLEDWYQESRELKGEMKKGKSILKELEELERLKAKYE